MSRQFLTIEAPEIRLLSSNGDAGTFEGYAAIFNELVPGYRERVMPGAFSKTLAAFRSKKRLPPMLWNHSSDDPVGIWTSIAEDTRGLRVAGKLVTTIRRGQEAREMLSAGMELGLSIAFRSIADRRAQDGIRELTEVDLIEVSLTPNPASENARITAFRNAAEQAETAAFLEAVRRAATSLR